MIEFAEAGTLPNFVLLDVVEEVTLERPAASAAGGEHESEPPKAALEKLDALWGVGVLEAAPS